MPLPVLDQYFPAGKPALVAAVTERYLADFQQRLGQHGPQSSTAVEEMLRVRHTLQALPSKMRTLFMQELEIGYPAQSQCLRAGQLVSVLTYVRPNLQRGMAEGLYQPQLDAEREAQRWHE